MAEIGRPTIMTDETLKKLEDGFIKGLSDREACLYAGISHQTLYNYQSDFPDYVDRKEQLKDSVKMRAKLNIEEAIQAKNLNLSQWYTERRDKEFSAKQEVDVTSKGESINNADSVKELSDKFNDFLKTQ